MGIGSRRTPAQTLGVIEQLAARLGGEGWTLRTGLSPGADQAFYAGARRRGGAIELYLPWPGFEEQVRLPGEGEEVSVCQAPTPAAYELAARHHRAWDRRRWQQLARSEQALLARDVQQVLGCALDAPAEQVVCWTPDGALDGESALAQGTGQALRVAHSHGVPVLNLARPGHLAAARALRVAG